MASGFGLNGGPGRCYAFWQEVLGCYVVNSPEGETGKKKCTPALDDYYECLHHRKEALRTMKMQAAYRKAEAASPARTPPAQSKSAAWVCSGRKRRLLQCCHNCEMGTVK
ncbi:hypothetical protein N7493_000254 [Penicillium malachiteum]|uniref:NADH dehydrogenase [ubiquinone] iron-sulfur protein 5 n=1 Tax=Penicillium malachiteum TaxID=1324776 RepID=A0AAD6N0U9_9EURO|nr:hypothetical protein N7493_000254 [Penicillium malachiteum]